ncbi:MAG: FAD binding domain-containing protein [Acidobacteria bacterium]|nr:FAD binding domain-containing protein [Acidobacteriota bacterium]
MRADPALYNLVAPPTLTDALALIANEPTRWTPIAGGTDLMVLYSAGKLSPCKLLSLNGYRELRGIHATPSELAIGASATYSDIRRHPVIRHEFPLLARAASWIGGIANQNRGTLGGNIANASPAGDSLPVLLVYNADLLLISARGQRLIPYSTFHTGYKKSIIAPDELIHSVILNRAMKIGTRHYVKKVGARNAQAVSKVYLAAIGRDCNGRIDSIRLAAGCVGPTPIRLIKSEQALEGLSLRDDSLAVVSKVLAEEVAPIDDIRSTARYRSAVLCNLLGEFLGMLAQPVVP